MRITFFFILFLLLSCKSSFVFREGDLLFQLSDCGSFCDAINKVTDGYNGIDFNHVGILGKDEAGNWEVLEAVTKGVVKTPLQTFLDRSLDVDGKPLVAVGRLRENYRYLIPMALTAGEKYIGKGYDQVFDLENDQYYCSELVYFTYLDSAGKPLFELNPMTFNDPGTGELFNIWEEYYAELGEEIPEGMPGLNPGGISTSKKLEIYFPFSGFGKNK